MHEVILVNYDDAAHPSVSGRELHEALGVETRYNDWFKRMCEYGFSEGEDFYSFLSKTPEGGRPATDHALSIPMAKEICMLQRTEKGKEIRRYFISVEEQWNSPEAIMARALRIADQNLEKAKIQIKTLQVENSSLTVDNQIMKPKADYFDELVDRNLLTNIRDTAKELGVKQNQFVTFLLEKKYMYRDKKGKLKPYAKHVEEGVFELKEFSNEKTGFSDTQTLITPKGRETFRLLFIPEHANKKPAKSKKTK
ncbi:MAG: antA/AntB antirepressor family protein [Oscillospiraceae bacterium]|nr:antA/AntB antirepressor family protein [Oscillospiraceae bacterium]